MARRMLALMVALLGVVPRLAAQETPPRAAAGVMGPVQTDRYAVSFVQLGAGNTNGLYYEPRTPDANARIALVYTYPRPRFEQAPAIELANRGYRVMAVRNYLGSRRGEVESPLDGVGGTSRAIAYLRKQPGVERVVVMGWGTGARLAAFYAAAAERGPAICRAPDLLYPCRAEEVTNLSKPDGVVLFDPGFGAATKASAMDPAYAGTVRSRANIDMYAAASGYDPATGSAHYAADFARRYFAAQSARNDALIDQALGRLQLIKAGQGRFKDDEPFTVPGAVNTRSAASLHKTDTRFLSHTKVAHLLLKADGTTSTEIIRSIRPPTGKADVRQVGACCENGNYGVRRFLANDAVRTTPEFALTEDDVKGVVWNTSATSTPASAEAITAPTLVLTQTCFQFVVPSEIVFDHLAARDKTFVANEGAEHFFGPCKPEYGDTKKRAFDFVAGWLAKPGRF